MRLLGGRLLLLLLALASFGGAVAQEGGSVTATALTPRLEARPGETVTLRLRVENAGGERASFTPRVTPPIGWTVLIPPGDVRLESGEARVVIFSLLVAPDAPARNNIFPVTYLLTSEGPQHEVAFAVRVPDIHDVTLTPLDGPAYVTAERFTTVFLLRNEGNIRETLTLTASSSASLPLALDHGSVTLEPGAAREVLVHASVPAELATSTRHVLTLQAGHPDLPDVQAVARSTSELVPRTPSATSAVHTFPLTARLSLEAGYDLAPRLSGPVVELYGTGSLSDRDPGRLTVHLETHLGRPFPPEDLLVSYRGADGRITAGNQSFSRSTLRSAQDGFGISAERRWRLAPPATVTGSASAYAASAGPALAAAAHVAVEGGFEGAVQAHGSSDGVFATLDARYRAPAANPSRLELALLEGSYAVRAAADQGTWGQAARLRARVREGPSNLDFRYQARTAAFTGTERRKDGVDLRAALRLNEALSLDSGSPLDLHLVYSNERSRPIPGSAREDRSVRTLGGTLTARLGRTSLSLGHHDEVTREGGTSAGEATAHLQAYLPLGKGANLRQRLAWVRPHPEADSSRLEYEATGIVATGTTSRLNVNLDLAMHLADGRLETLNLGARWVGPLSKSWSLEAEATVDLLGQDEVIGVQADLRRVFANDHEVEVDVGATLREQRPPQITIGVAYVVPLQVPMGPRSDVGTIRGSVHTVNGAPLAGVIVTAAGTTAVTGADGHFVLAAVNQGNHLVHLVPSTIPVESPVIHPASPAAVDVQAGTTAHLAFEITPGATIAGRLAPPAAAPLEDDRGVLRPEGDAERWLQGATIEITNGVSTLRATTDASGSFLLPRVPPGTWTVRLRHSALPDDYRIEPTEQQLEVRAGEREHAEFQLIPVTRTIRFQEGERLGGDE